jgi:DNA repair ATPase RecN
MVINDYALNAIEAAPAKSHLSCFYLIAISPFISSTTHPLSEIIMETFNEAISVMSSSIHRLILEAQNSLANLEKLEEYLSTIHELLSREDLSISSAKSQLLSELWTKLGGNRKALQEYDSHLFLLSNLSTYRRKSLSHVVAALVGLQEMSDNMEDLRERVTALEIAGRTIPVEVHMKSICTGLEQLRDWRKRTCEGERDIRKGMYITG